MQTITSTITGISTGNVHSAAREFGRASQAGNQSGDASPFGDFVSNAVSQIGQLEDQARVATDRMMAGIGVDVHQAMIATQKSSMAFELALSVRNKAIQAYQSVLGMQF